MTADTLWTHPWAFALIVAVIGFVGELMLYTSEEGAAAMYGLAAGVIAYLVALVLRMMHRAGGGAHHRRLHRFGAGAHRPSH